MTRSKIWFLPISLIFLFLARVLLVKPVYKNGDLVRITSTVYSDPIQYSSSQYLKLSGLKVYLPKTPEITYGDKITVEGKVDNGSLVSPKVVKVFDNSNFLSVFRNSVIDFYENSLPQPESGLLAGIVLGSKNGVQGDFYDKTKLTGVAHVVVASGTNVTFVTAFLFSVVTLYLPRKKAIPFVILGIILYLFMAGFEAPLVRAAIMSLSLFLSQETGRLASSWRIFLITALLMLIYNPTWISDVGFLLSFASTGSLMLFEKRIEEKFKFLPKFVKQDFSTSLAAQVGVAPILFVTFGHISILSPVVNALVLWVVAPLMVIGSVGGVLGLILPGVGKLILWLGYPMLWWFTRTVEIFA